MGQTNETGQARLCKLLWAELREQVTARHLLLSCGGRAYATPAEREAAAKYADAFCKVVRMKHRRDIARGRRAAKKSRPIS